MKLSTEQLIANLEIIENISRAPLYNSLEVGFRHSPLTTNEQLERYAESCRVINEFVVDLIKIIRN